MNSQVKRIIENRQAILNSDYNYLDKMRMAYALELYTQKEITIDKLNELGSYKNDPQWQTIYGKEFNSLNSKVILLSVELRDILNSNPITAHRILNATGISIE